MGERLQSLLDRVAMGLSGLCLVHCLALPVALMVVPMLGLTVFSHEAVHSVFLYVAVPVSAVALGLGMRRHRNPRYALMAAVGLLIMYAALGQPDIATERLLSVAGVTLVAIAHIFNLRRRKFAAV